MIILAILAIAVIIGACWLILLLIRYLLDNPSKVKPKEPSLHKRDKKVARFIEKERLFKERFQFVVEDYLEYIGVTSCNIFLTEKYTKRTYKDDVPKKYYVAEVIAHCKDSKGKKFDKFYYIQYGHKVLEQLEDNNYIIINYFQRSIVEKMQLNNFYTFLTTRKPFEKYSSFDEFISYDVCEMCYTLSDSLIDIRDAAKALEEQTKDWTDEIKSILTEVRHMTKIIDDIDVTVSVSELVENVETILEISVNFSVNKKQTLLKDCFDSLKKVSDYVEEFNNLKKKKALTTEHENKLQDDIDVEVEKSSRIIETYSA